MPKTKAASTNNGKASASDGGPRGLTYADAGVDLETYDRFIGSIGPLVRRTHGPRVISNDGGFAGLFRLDYNEKLFARNYKDPVLVACTDGVGTKVKLAADLDTYDTVGIDLVAMSINDLIVEGAEPLFFLDYIAVGDVRPSQLRDLVKGVAAGCQDAECALIGGETAEMPDVYSTGEFDMAGFAVGVVELKRATDPTRLQQGDIILGLESDGVHSNGYSLVRAVVKKARLNLSKPCDELTPKPKGRKKRSAQSPTLGEALLTPTRIYARPVVQVLRQYRVKKVVSAMAHITGGGLAGNIERVLPDNLDASIDRKAWTVPPVFRFLQERGKIDEEEMRRVFNMGIGFVMVVRPSFAASITERLRKSGERVHTIGKIVKGSGQVKERA